MKFNAENMKWLYVIYPLAVCLLLYGQVVHFDYVWDDIIIFLNKNSLISDPLSWSLLTMPVLDGTSYMRPAVIFSWWLEFKVFGQNPAISHAVNLFLFCINVYLVNRISARLIEKIRSDSKPLLPSLAALAYATHPALIESTAWVAGRFDLLCTTGILSASLLYLSSTSNIITRYLGIVFFMILALLSKELGVVAPLILFCIGMAFYSSAEKNTLQNMKGILQREPVLWFFVFSTVVIYFLIRKYSIQTIYHESWSFEYFLATLISLEPLEALSGYIKITFLPFNNIGIFHPPVAESARKLNYYLSLLLTFSLSSLVIWSALIKQRAWAWLMIAAGAGIVLVLHFIPMTISDNIIQERFITTSLAYVCIATTLLPWNRLFKAKNKKQSLQLKKVLFFIFSIWFMLAIITTATILPMWKKDVLLWNWTYQKYPTVESVRNGFLNSSVLANRFDLVKSELQKLIDNKADLTVSDRYYYGLVLMGENNPESIIYFKSIIDEASDSSNIKKNYFKKDIPILIATYKYYSFSVLSFNNDIEEAKKYINLADELTNSNEKGFIYFAKAAIYYADGQFDLAENLVRKGKSNYFHYNESSIEQMRQLLTTYCSWAKPDEDKRMKTCKKLIEKNVI